MRLITRKIWRAFPELDRFDDERCARFVEAAKQGKVSRAVRAILSVATGLPFVIATLVLATVAADRIKASTQRFGIGGVQLRVLAVMAIVFVGVAIGGALALLVRDRLLRRRVRRFINTRGRCTACSYALLGLPVPETLQLRCPECGLEMEVDAALTELAEGGGKRIFAKAPDDRWLPAWLTAVRLRYAAKITVVLAVVALLGLGAWWLYREWYLIKQAELAASERIGFRDVARINADLNPSADGSPDAWTILDALSAIRVQAETEVLSATDDSEGSPPVAIRINYRGLVSKASIAETSADRDRRLLEERLTRRVLLRARELGLFAEIDKLAAARRAVRPWPEAIPANPLTGPDFRFNDSQALVWINLSRMQSARLSGDQAEFIRALRVNLVIIRMTEREPFFISRILSAAFEAGMARAVRAALMDDIPRAWIEAIHDCYSELPPGAVPLSATLEGERSALLDALAWFFSDVTRVKQGPTPAFFGVLGQAFEGRLGSYVENRDAVKAIFDHYAREASKPAWEADFKLAGQAGDLALIANFRYFDRILGSFTTARAEHEGFMAMLAVERFHAEHGTYPSSLVSLVPKYLDLVPRDPATGEEIRYILRDPQVDPQHRAYVIYFVGSDGIDNAGESNGHLELRRGDAAFKSIPGSDFVINDLNR